ncbi:LacI family DNA-binding transcriptional regulator [Leifsonia sp. 2MCAF36]|uniref:LacI family DNA-binding transcriptional regulator n=1 Tax=Leifsonia sp. 2MCAF36 TaxID=3232988 RepID=UPI003F9B8A2F
MTLEYRPTILDVAQTAGVSSRTVARVIQRSAAVSVATQARVEQAMREIGYFVAPHGAAAGTTQIAVIAMHGINPTILHGVLDGVTSEGRRRGLLVTQADVIAPADNLETSLLEVVGRKVEEGASGAILVATADIFAKVAAVLAHRLPVVLALAEHETASSVTIDWYNGAVQATRHLLALGHTELAHVAGPANLVHARARAQGFLDTLEEAGLEPVDVVSGDWSAAAGFAAGERLLESRASAVFCASDQLALGVMHAFARAGRPAPDGISVVGYDDEPGAAFFTPALTTIRLDYRRVGVAAIEVLAQAEAAGAPRHADLVPELIVRGSTARPDR